MERECAIGMLKANVTPSIVAKQFPCHARTIGRLKNRFQQIETTSHRVTRASTCVDATSRLSHPDVSFVRLISSGVSHS